MEPYVNAHTEAVFGPGTHVFTLLRCRFYWLLLSAKLSWTLDSYAIKSFKGELHSAGSNPRNGAIASILEVSEV